MLLLNAVNHNGIAQRLHSTYTNCRLYVVRGKPEEVFPKLFKEWKVEKITWEVDTEPYARIRDEKVERLARDCGVKVVSLVGHTLYNTEK